MKKILLVAALLGALAVAGCGSSGTDKTTTVIEKVAPATTEEAPAPATTEAAPAPDPAPAASDISPLAYATAEYVIAEEPEACSTINEGVEVFGRSLAEKEYVAGYVEESPGEEKAARESFDAMMELC